MTFYHLDMIDRWQIEARIASADRAANAKIAEAEREADAAIASMARQHAANMNEVRNQYRKVECAVIELRSDMLEGMGDLADQIAAQGKQISQDLVQIEMQQLMTLQALQDQKRTLGLISQNLINGFERSFHAQDQIKASLDRLEQGLHEMRQDIQKLHEAAANPATTAALERYRLALLALTKGQAADAMGFVDAAIRNDGLFHIVHLPQITFLRGCFYLGQFDDAENAWLHPELALKDFTKALDYSEGASGVPLIKDRLAYAHFLSKQYDRAERLYSELAQDGGPLAMFDRGRCLLGLGDAYGAAQLFEGMFREDPTLALLPAADPFCQTYAVFFRDLGLMMARADQERRDAAQHADRARQDATNRARAQLIERQERLAAEEKVRFSAERQRLARIASIAFRDVAQDALKKAMACVGQIQSLCLDCGPELALAEAALRKRGIDEALIAESAPADLEQLTQIYTRAKEKVDQLILGSGLRPWQPVGRSDTLITQMVSGVEQIARGSDAAAQGVTDLVQAVALRRPGDIPGLVMPRLAPKRRMIAGKVEFDQEIQAVDEVFRKAVATRHGARLQELARSLDSELTRVRAYRSELSSLRRTLRNLR